jgi:biotin transport system substrate-specific component
MLANVTVADVFRPCEKKLAWVYDAALIVGGSLFIGLCAQLAIPIGPVPITAQTFAVLMTGALFGSWRGVLSVLVYIAEGVAGLPIFSMGRSGFVMLLGTSGGYLVGFVAAACVAGLLAEKGWDRRFGTTILAMVFGSMAMYAFALGWLCLLMGVNKSVLTFGLYPFIVGDVLKIILAAVVLPAGWKLIAMLNFLAGNTSS